MPAFPTMTACHADPGGSRTRSSWDRSSGHLMLGSFCNAGMYAGRVLSGGQLVEQLFILIGDPLPVIDGAYPLRSATPVFFRKLRLLLDQMNFFSQLVCITEKQSIRTKHLGIEHIGMGQDAIAISKGLKQGRL